jgi:hypothetical protein
MHKQKKFLIALIVLLLSGLACSTAEMFAEKTTLKIVSPVRDFRMVDELAEGEQFKSVSLSVQLNTNREVDIIPANVILNNTAPVVCYLKPNEITDCFILPIYNKGQQTVRVELVTLKGEVVSDEVPFLWEPYMGFDKTALMFSQILGKNDPTLGSYIIGILIMAVFAVSFGAFARTAQGMVFGIIASLLMFIAMFIYYKPEVAANLFIALIGLVSSGFVAAIVIYALNKGYTIRTGTHNDILIEDRYTGLRLQDKSKSGFSFGPGQYTGSREAQAFEQFMILNDATRRRTPLQPVQANNLLEENGQYELMSPQPAKKMNFRDWLWAGLKSKIKRSS